MYALNSSSLIFPEGMDLREIAFNVTVLALVSISWIQRILVLILLSSRDLRDVCTEKSVQLDFFTLEKHNCF